MMCRIQCHGHNSNGLLDGKPTAIESMVQFSILSNDSPVIKCSSYIISRTLVCLSIVAELKAVICNITLQYTMKLEESATGMFSRYIEQ